MTKHIYVKHKSYKECSGPPAMCPICDGGLSLCSVCGLAEGALTTDCPGRDCSDLSDVVYKGAIDYIGGEWVVGASPHSPASIRVHSFCPETTINAQLKDKVLRLAARVCRMHGSVVGDRMCQDWSGETDLLDVLTPIERNTLQWIFEQDNSEGRDFEADYFTYDEMCISYIMESALKSLTNDEP